MLFKSINQLGSKFYDKNFSLYDFIIKKVFFSIDNIFFRFLIKLMLSFYFLHCFFIIKFNYFFYFSLIKKISFF